MSSWTKAKSNRRGIHAFIAVLAAALPFAACATSADIPADVGDAALAGFTGGGPSYSTGGFGTGGFTPGTGGIPGTGGRTGTGGLTGTGGTTSCPSGQTRCSGSCVTPAPSNGCGSCTPCPTAPANSQATCTSGQCDFTCNTGYSKSGSTCAADPTCTDKVKNGTETDVDCGGSTCPKCAPGLACSVDADCAKGPCQSGVCGCTAATCASANSCSATLDDGCGNTIDCSQSCTTPAICYQNQCCTKATACPSTSCDPAQTDGCGGTLDCTTNCASPAICYNLACCTPKACGTQCGHPTDGCGTTLDCGLCPDGSNCVTNSDCQSGVCQNNACVSCTDGVKNNGETDVDCGGPNCPTCANGKTCSANSDCTSGNCCALFEFGNCFLKPVGTCQ